MLAGRLQDGAPILASLFASPLAGRLQDAALPPLASLFASPLAGRLQDATPNSRNFCTFAGFAPICWICTISQFLLVFVHFPVFRWILVILVLPLYLLTGALFWSYLLFLELKAASVDVYTSVFLVHLKSAVFTDFRYFCSFMQF